MVPWESGQLAEAANAGLYARLVAESATREFAAARDIGKDIDRTMPSHPFYQTPEGVASLQRVLASYAMYNPKIGYTQSMNFLCALWLLYMKEEMAFFMLMTVCEQIAPHAYRKSMVGSVAQLAVLERLLERFSPALYVSLARQGFACSMVATGWLMCLFITFLPWEICLRIIDVFLCSSPTILFRVSLAIFVVNESALLECDGIEEILELLHRRDYQVEQLLTTAFCMFDISEKELQSMLDEETARAIRTVANDGEKRMVATIATHFSREETMALYLRFTEHMSSVLAPGTIGRDEFVAALLTEVPRWDRNLALLAFEDACSKNKGGVVSFEPFIRILSVLKRGSLEERLTYCLGLFMSPEGGGTAAVAAGLRALTLLYGVVLEHSEIQDIAIAVRQLETVQDACSDLLRSGLLEANGIGGAEVESEVGGFEVL